MNYIGSKQNLLPFLDEVFAEMRTGAERVFCDLFAGTGAVGRHFRRRGLHIIANDLQYYAYVLNRACVGIARLPEFLALQPPEARGLPAEEGVARVLAELNALPGLPGFLTRSYSPVGGRLFFTEQNARHADAVRSRLEEWRAAGRLSADEYFYLLASLLEAVDEVANTASVYGAYLKRFKATARRPLRLRPLDLPAGAPPGEVYCEDSNTLIERLECDVLYLDPPYNQRQYGANYHVLETVARYDAPEIGGAAGLREYPRSRYCRRGEVQAAFTHLLRTARARLILVSYNDEGLLGLEQLRAALALRGEPRTFTRERLRYKADRGRTYSRERTLEYVHAVRVVR